MKKSVLLLAGASMIYAMPAFAQSAPIVTAVQADPLETSNAQKEVFSTGVAKGRDRLDSATSTSAMKASEIEKLGARPLGDVLRTMAGLRVESAIGEGNANITVRGLPLAAGGSKYMQLEEDGLPVLEFGDIFNIAADVYIRADFNLAQIESIRGGSGSTFASNSPGGLINLISETGETEGGAIRLTTGLDYGEKRFDFDYGGKLSETLRYHFGGFYRAGEGPRDIGYTGFKGGQFKFNITKQFGNGYVRLYLKFLDDRSPTFAPYFVHISGTNDNPVISNFAGFDIRKDSVLSPNVGPIVTLNGQNNLSAYPISDGQHAISKSIGLEAQFDVAGWTISDRVRYSMNSGDFSRAFPSTVDNVAAFAASQAGAGATASYATGPLAGQLIPAGVNGNGLLALYFISQTRARSLDNFTNDLRATRVWRMGNGDLTLTGGLYKANQDLHTEWLHTAIDVDANGGGDTAMVNITGTNGVSQTLNGYYAFSRNGSKFRRIFNVDYDILAPYGSINYHFGKIAIGGSVRYDFGWVRGSLYGADLGGGRIGVISYDINGDGVISPAETRVGWLDLTRPAPVHYNYGYLSYSGGINYRVAEPFSVFARYSKGGRANADKILFTPSVSTADGSVPDASDKYDKVDQLEGGFKLRTKTATLNATAFLVHADDHNVLNGSGNRTIRTYRAYGLELEGSLRHGPFSITAGATYTKAKITRDQLDPTLTGKEPRHQPAWTLEATPQFETRLFTIGANVVTITDSYAQDVNQLKMPGFTVVNAFAQLRPADRIEISLNASNLFNTIGIFEINQSTMPANGIGLARSINGRTVSASVRFDL